MNLARVRLDGQLMHVLTQDGVLWRTLPCPIHRASVTDCKPPTASRSGTKTWSGFAFLLGGSDGKPL